MVWEFLEHPVDGELGRVYSCIHVLPDELRSNQISNPIFRCLHAN